MFIYVILYRTLVVQSETHSHTNLILFHNNCEIKSTCFFLHKKCEMSHIIGPKSTETFDLLLLGKWEDFHIKTRSYPID